VSTLDNFRTEAKRWLKALRTNDREARARLRSAYPNAPAEPGLRDVYHALAREHGQESWVALKARLAASGQAESSGTPLTALLDAASRGEASRVAELLDAHPELVSQRGSLSGHTGLRTALHFGVRHEDVVRCLLDRRADPNIRDEGDNAMPLHFAAENGHFPIIRLLVEHGADPIGTGDGHELDVIGWATCFGSGSKEIVDYLLAHGSIHNIFSAVAMGEVDVIRELAAQSRGELDRPMDTTNHRRRPLHLAVVKKQPRALAALLDLGADTEAIDAAGLTALDQAALNGEREMAQLLVDRGATVGLPAAVGLERTEDVERLLRDHPDCLKPGKRWAHLIVRAGAQASAGVIEALIRYGASVNVRDDPSTSVDSTRGYTALHAAGFHGNQEAAAVLLKHGADPTIRDDKYCGTPAGWANYAGHAGVRDVILTGPIDIFEAIDRDRPDLIASILERDPAALTRPFAEYASCEPRPDQWWPEPCATPLAWAVAQNKVAAARVLAAHGAEGSTRRHAERVATFLQFACWDHHIHGKGDHRMHDRAAQRLLAQHPEIARASLYTATVCGDLEEVVRILAERPEAAHEPGGSRGWPPLLYLCFTRFIHPQIIDNALAIARALLDRGADPNAYYMAGDARYTALVGVAGEGEQDSPRQPYAPALFQLLLERGAEPFDIQVLYNTHFSGDMIWWLELVYAHTVKQGRKAAWDDPNWSMLDMGGYGPGAYFILKAALEKNDLRLAEWVLTHGAGPDARASSHPKFKPKRTHYERAVFEGLTEMADLLARFGAVRSTPVLAEEEAFVAACLRLDRDAVRAQLETHPEYLHSPKALFAAARRDRDDVVAFLLDLGVPLESEDETHQRALHVAASHNAMRVAKLLVDRGAEIDPREANWNATPIGFAAYGERFELVDFLSRFSKNVWTLVFRGYVDRLREVLQAEPDLAKAVTNDGSTPLCWLPDDEAKAIEIVKLLLAHGADPTLRSKDGQTAADWARKLGMLDVARMLAVNGESDAPETPPEPPPDVQKYDRLAQALVFAYETGHANSMASLQEHARTSFTWQELRASVRERLDALGSERPDGYFALPHARLLIARQAGFENWAALTKSLGGKSTRFTLR